MKILHISDFHFRREGKTTIDHEKLVSALIKSTGETKFDLILFTGDLVNKGGNLNIYEEASDALFTRLRNSILKNSNNLFFCAGNHDVFRNQELNPIGESINTIKNCSELNEFIKSQDGRQFEASLHNFQNYNKFLNKSFSYDIINNVIEKLYTIHFTKIGDKKIAITTLNSAWRSKGDNDRGNLLYPTRFVKEILDRINHENCDCKILLMHHPISDFKIWNANELEDLIYSEFHILLSGHVHKNKNGVLLSNGDGIFLSAAPASLSLYDDTSEVGYTILDLDFDNWEISIDIKYYHKKDNDFLHKSENQRIEIPLSNVKKSQNEFRRKIRKVYERELSNANELFLNSSDSNDKKSFLELFITPVLKNKSKAELTSEDSIHLLNQELEKIVSDNNNYIILGKDKSGKTSLLYKSMLIMLDNYNFTKTLPFFIDSAQYKSKLNRTDIKKLIADFYQLPKSKLDEILSNNKIYILVDNFNENNTDFNNSLFDFFKKHTNYNFIFTAEETIKSGFLNFESIEYEFQFLYIHEISRNEIRKLTNIWPNIPREKRDDVIEKINQIFVQLNIPMNYWTVSLFLWIFEKTSNVNFHNNFELIQLYVDNLLDRKGIVLDKTLKIDFEEFKSFLGALSYYFLKECKENNYSCEYSQLVAFTEEYRSKNIRFVIGTETILNIIKSRNILKKNEFEQYTFRLNGVFEYFLAYHMKDNAEFKKDIIGNEHYYLSFSNELELYSGFSKKDTEFLLQIYNITKGVFSSLQKEYPNSRSKDEILLEKITSVYDVYLPINPSHEVNVQISDQQRDELMQEIQPIDGINSEVSLKKYYENIEASSENLEKALKILARVFRNSSINDIILNDSILDFILDSACNLGFKLIDESNENDSNILDLENPDDKTKTIVKLMTSFMPLIVQTFLFDALYQNNLERMIIDKINYLKKDTSNNQFKLYVLYFLLIDLDPKHNKKYLDELFNVIEIPILKRTTLFKLYSYLIFKTNSSKEFEKYIQNKIQEMTISLNNKTDLGQLHQGLERTKKIGIVKRGKFK